jgi:hypothetical protein
LLDLPPIVQQEVAAGYISNIQIRDLFTLHSNGTTDDVLAAVRKIKDGKAKGKAVSISSKAHGMKKKSKRHRTRTEIFKMLETIQLNVGNNFGTRCLAWCSGEITTGELLEDIVKLCEEEGITYRAPQEDIDD